MVAINRLVPAPKISGICLLIKLWKHFIRIMSSFARMATLPSSKMKQQLAVIGSLIGKKLVELNYLQITFASPSTLTEPMHEKSIDSLSELTHTRNSCLNTDTALSHNQAGWILSTASALCEQVHSTTHNRFFAIVLCVLILRPCSSCTHVKSSKTTKHQSES